MYSIHVYTRVTWLLPWTPRLTANCNDPLTKGLISCQCSSSHHWLDAHRLVECKYTVNDSSCQCFALLLCSMAKNRWSEWTKGQTRRRRLACLVPHRGHLLLWCYHSYVTQVFLAPLKSLVPYFIITGLSSSESQWDEEEMRA